MVDMKNAAAELQAAAARFAADRIAAMPADDLLVLAHLLKETVLFRGEPTLKRSYSTLWDVQETIAELLAPDALGTARTERAREIYQEK